MKKIKHIIVLLLSMSISYTYANNNLSISIKQILEQKQSTILDVLKGDVSIQKAISRTEGIDILPSDITLSSSGLEYNPGEVKRIYFEKMLLKPVMDFL